MSYDDPDDDEDWYDEDEDQLEEIAAQCPECGGPVYMVTHKCPACGYWLAEADRRSMWRSESKPKWIKLTAAVVLIVLLVTLLIVGTVFL